MTAKQCTKCQAEKPVEFFNWENTEKQIRDKRCKSCTRARCREHYKNNKQQYLKRNRTRSLNARKFVWDYLKNNPCVDCGEADPLVLEFDHLDPATKTACVSTLVTRYPLKRTLAEIEKCVIRCANCHRRKTAYQLGYYKEFLDT